MQRMMLKRLDYQFKVTYKKGKELHVADTLSRAALKDSFEWQQSDVFRMELVEMDLKPSNVTADTLERIRTETSKDPVLSILNSVTMTGWPDERKSVPEEIRGFWSYREFSRFARDNGFALVKSSPYHSRGNGQVESAVKIAKNILKKSREEDPYIALLAYRNTPQQDHVYSPAQRLISRRLRDLIPMATSKLQRQLTVSSVVTQNIAERKQKAKAHYI